MSNQSQKVSLSFSKIIVKKNLQTSALRQDPIKPSGGSIQEISSFDKDCKIISSTKSPEDNLVIPMVQTNRESMIKSLLNKSNKEVNEKVKITNEPETKKMSLDEKAALALLEGSNEKLQEKKKENLEGVPIHISTSHSGQSIPTEGKISTLEDYEQVHVETFGSALLRGMGWAKDKGIGKNNKRVIEIIDPSNKGFALSNSEVKKKKKDDTQRQCGVETMIEEDDLKRGSHVFIHGGRNRGVYGIVESVDEDHVLIRAAREDSVVREVEQNIRVVPAKEYKDSSRVINKDMYDKYKAAELQQKKDKRKEKDDKFLKNLNKGKHFNENNGREKNNRKKEEESESEGDRDTEPKRGDATQRISRLHCYNNRAEEDSLLQKLERLKKAKREKYRPPKDEKKEITPQSLKSGDEGRGRNDKYTNKIASENKGKHKEKRNKKGEGTPKDAYSTPQAVIPWARENLKVRIIDKIYKDGRYHKTKVLVRSIDTVESCTCQSEEGKMLYDVNPNNLETVIPKTPSAVVLIVKGKYKGQKARILELQREREKAVLQLLQDSSIILQLYYDDICEYISR